MTAIRIGREPYGLRPLGGADASNLHALWTAPGVRRYLWDREIIPFERTSAILERNERLFAEQRFGLWGFAAGERLIGFAGLWHFREPPELELIYGLAEDAWGRGHATAIARAVIEYAFESLEMAEIRASTDAGNGASVRVLEKLGFARTERRTVAGLDTIFFELRRTGIVSAGEARDA